MKEIEMLELCSGPMAQFNMENGWLRVFTLKCRYQHVCSAKAHYRYSETFNQCT